MRTLLLLSVAMGLLTAASASTIFDTTSSLNGTHSISPFGFPDTGTFGQTFIAPATDTTLDDFTFYLDVPGGTTLQFKALIFAWSGSLLGGGGGEATGAPLYESSSITAVGDDTFDPFTVNTGGVQLTGGDSYVALFTVSDTPDYDASTGTAEWGNIASHVTNDGGGGFVFYNTGGDISLINTTQWDNFADDGDSTWKADFTNPVVTTAPEPSALSLLTLGLVVIAITAVRL